MLKNVLIAKNVKKLKCIKQIQFCLSILENAETLRHFAKCQISDIAGNTYIYIYMHIYLLKNTAYAR